MRNLLISDFYKLKKQKSLWICLIVVAVLLLISILTIKAYSDMLEEMSGLLVPTMTRDFVFSAPASCDLNIFLAIFVALYFIGEFSNGTIKNTLSVGTPRYQVYLSKFIMLVTIAAAYILIAMIISLIIGLFCFPYGATFTFAEFGRIIGMWLLSTLIFAAYAAVFMFVGIVVSSVGASIAINLLVFSFFASLFVTIVAMIPTLFPDAGLEGLANIGDYLLSGMIAKTADINKLTNADIWRMIYMPISYILAFGGAGIAVFIKKDIK